MRHRDRPAAALRDDPWPFGRAYRRNDEGAVFPEIGPRALAVVAGSKNAVAFKQHFLPYDTRALPLKRDMGRFRKERPCAAPSGKG